MEELGLGAYIPGKVRDPDFQALTEMCSSWLMHPNELGRPPDFITQIDSRELNWPPSGDRRRFWLFKYRCEPRAENQPADEGIGLVGSITFALLGETTTDLTPEDVYALHCCWELEIYDGSKEFKIANGRRLLAEISHDLR